MLLYQWHKEQNQTLVEVGFLVGFIGSFFRWVHPKNHRVCTRVRLNPDRYSDDITLSTSSSSSSSWSRSSQSRQLFVICCVAIMYSQCLQSFSSYLSDYRSDTPHTPLVHRLSSHINNNNNNNVIYIAPACRMTSEALADSSSRATECLTEKQCFKSAFKSTNRARV